MPRTTDSAHRAVVTLPRLIDADRLADLVARADLLHRCGGLDADIQVPGSSAIYGDPVFDQLLADLGNTFSSRVGLRLGPTYSFYRRYVRGNELLPHRDRAECEYSITLHLSSATSVSWPIWLREGRGEPESIDLDPGDGVGYRGPALLHWREPLADDWHSQLFLHFVDLDGPHHDRLFDGRPRLGVPRRT